MSFKAPLNRGPLAAAYDNDYNNATKKRLTQQQTSKRYR